MSVKSLLFCVAIAVLTMPASVYAQLGTQDTGLQATVQSGYGVSGTIIGLPEFIGKYIINPILGLSGTIIFFLMAWAGFLWMTAAGDTKRVEKSKMILSQCVVGLVILVGSYALTNYLITIFA